MLRRIVPHREAEASRQGDHPFIVRQDQTDRARTAFAHRLRGAMRPIAELLGRAQDLLPHRRTDVRLVVEHV